MAEKKAERNGAIRDSGQPIMMIQDSKHALKTFRNNLFSGTRLLVLGNFVAIYAHIRQLAFESGGPLYHRDVEKLDRQDDNAATRLFSAETLYYLTEHHPEWIGEIVYLFVFGELVDAYQNRQIPHSECIEMALHAQYFMNYWKTFLDTTGYQSTRYFLSREAADITQFLIHGLISLILIYRDHTDQRYPLLPWLHSSEPCEHVFGEARRIVEDFSMLDFFYMAPKLTIKLREAALRAQSSDSKARASGYNHTYLDVKGMNIVVLASFPVDEAITGAASQAAEEAESLLQLLGLTPTMLQHSVVRRTAGLPSIQSWFGSEVPPNTTNRDASDRDAPESYGTVQVPELELEDEDYIDDEPLCTSEVLRQLLQDEEDKEYYGEERTNQEEEEMRSLCRAALGLVADDIADIEALPEPDDAFLKEMGAAESQYIQDTFSDFSLAPLNLPDQPSRPFGMGNITTAMLDFSALVGMHRQHETDYAAQSVRTRDVPAQVEEGSSGGDELDARAQKAEIKKQIVQRLRDQKAKEQARAQTTGRDRAFRWVTSDTTGTTSGDNTEAGTSANAAAVASVAARRALLRRKEAFRKTDSPCLDDLVGARISQIRPLQPKYFAFVYTDFGVMVGQVVTIYAKTAGKNGKHASIVDAVNVAAISNVGVQLFQELLGSQFTAIPHMMVAWQAKRFALLPSQTLLSLLSSGSPAKSDEKTLELRIDDSSRFRSLRQGERKLSEAMKLLKGRKFQPEEPDE